MKCQAPILATNLREYCKRQAVWEIQRVGFPDVQVCGQHCKVYRTNWGVIGYRKLEKEERDEDSKNGL